MQVLAIGNAGLVVGVQREQILEEYNKYGEIVDVVMVRSQPYSFIKFRKLEDAKAARDNTLGVLPTFITSLKVPLYVFYVDQGIVLCACSIK